MSDPSPPLLGRDLTSAMIDHLDPSHDETPSLPHPLTTDALLAEHLHRLEIEVSDRGNAAKAGLDLRARSRVLARRVRRRRIRRGTRDAAALEAVLHALHQLDHRTQHQRQELAALRAEVERLRAGRSAHEADDDR